MAISRRTEHKATHSLWGWCQYHPVTGTTWCSLPLSLCSSSLSVYFPVFGGCLKHLRSTFLTKIHPSKNHSWPKKWTTSTTLITAHDGNIVKKITSKSESHTFSTSQTPAPHFSSSFSCVNIPPGSFFWSGPPLSASLPISSGGPSLSLHIHIHTRWYRAGMLGPSPLAVQLANPWTFRDLDQVGKLNHRLHHAPSSRNKIWNILWKIFGWRFLLSTLSIQYHSLRQSIPKFSVLKEWGWDTSHTNLRPWSPGFELYSLTSIWMAIVQVWIHPLPESLVCINELKNLRIKASAGPFFRFQASLSSQLCAQLFPPPFHPDCIDVFNNIYGSHMLVSVSIFLIGCWEGGGILFKLP